MPCTMPYWKAVGIAWDQLFNAHFRGWPDETLSSRCWRLHRDGKKHWPRKLVDTLLFWDKNHCQESYESERIGRQIAPEFRPRIEK